MLAAGGSAVDAILATAITLTLVEPVSNGIGSDAFAILWDGKQLHGLNASGRSPAGWTLDYFGGQKTMPTRGWNTATVPGAVSAWVELHKRFGKLPFEKLFERAIQYGREGFLVSPTIAGQWAKQVAELKSQPGYAEAFMPNGRAPTRMKGRRASSAGSTRRPMRPRSRTAVTRCPWTSLPRASTPRSR